MITNQVSSFQGNSSNGKNEELIHLFNYENNSVVYCTTIQSKDMIVTYVSTLYIYFFFFIFLH